jgi:hypothetical protein
VVSFCSLSLFAFGGTADGKIAFKYTERYPINDPENGWTEQPDMPEALWGFATVPMETLAGISAVRLIGGQLTTTTLASATQVFKPEVTTGVWSSAEKIPSPRVHIGGATVCTTAKANETSPPTRAPSPSSAPTPSSAPSPPTSAQTGEQELDDEDLEIILGVVGGCVLLILVIGTAKLMKAGKKTGPYRDVQYQTFPAAAGTNTDV